MPVSAPIKTSSDSASLSDISQDRRRGRGAGVNMPGRFENITYDDFDDGWEGLAELPAFKTTVQTERARSIITRNQSPDLPFDRSINPYRGCEHGCIYCFARPSHSFLGLSPGLDFETRLTVKTNSAEVLERELSRPNYNVRPLAIGTNTDPYQPIERKHKVMREVLEVLERCRHPVAILTKSALVVRDTDILNRMAEQNLVRVGLSLTTLDRKLSRSMEPRASAPQKRLDAVKALSEAGIPVSVMTAPIIPALNDCEIEAMLEAAAEHGATEAGYVLLRLPREVSELFRDWLVRERPGHYRRVMNLIRSMRGGKDYDANWGERMRGAGPYAEQIAKRFRLAARNFNLNTTKRKLNCDAFIQPRQGGVQLDLF